MAAKKKLTNLSKKGVSRAKAATVKGGTLSNVSKTRSEISMTFARNARA